eukprot:COSAG01_NODE_2509_length_7549_cov_22.865235_3_plen_101_part_00
MLWILLGRIVNLGRMRGRRRGAVSCVNTLRLCALVSLLALLKVRCTAALYYGGDRNVRAALYAAILGRNFIIRLQGRSYGADGLDLASAVKLFLAVSRVV